MFDIKLLRDDPKRVQAGLKSKNVNVDVDAIRIKDEEYRVQLQELEVLLALKNKANETITALLKEKADTSATIAEMKTISNQITTLESHVKILKSDLHAQLLELPNLPHSSVPLGGASANTVVKTWGQVPTFAFTPKDHVALAESLDLIDFKRATKLSGANFILYKGWGAKLERALINFMLDFHSTHHGYTEVFPPVLVNAESMTGTGQLPKMKDDMYRLPEDDLYLIPTAEVPVTNIHRSEILDEVELPKKYTAYSPCFRREAGSYGKDTRGLVRIHQFNKVELVKFVEPDHSYAELELLLGNAERIFQELHIPYRVLELASGDLSFAAAKCYDIEVFAAGCQQWLEASSCSNFEDFQSRRANIRYRSAETKKTAFVHTLNGSGVALPRTVIAILENNQQADGSIRIPECLQPYMGGADVIS